MFAGRPELRPGATSWQSVQARKAPVAEDLQGLVRQAADRNPQIVAATADVEAAVYAAIASALPRVPSRVLDRATVFPTASSSLDGAATAT